MRSYRCIQRINIPPDPSKAMSKNATFLSTVETIEEMQNNLPTTKPLERKTNKQTLECS